MKEVKPLKIANILFAVIWVVIIGYLIYVGEWYAVLAFIAATIFIMLRRIRKDIIN